MFAREDLTPISKEIQSCQRQIESLEDGGSRFIYVPLNPSDQDLHVDAWLRGVYRKIEKLRRNTASLTKQLIGLKVQLQDENDERVEYLKAVEASESAKKHVADALEIESSILSREAALGEEILSLELKSFGGRSSVTAGISTNNHIRVE